MNRKFSVLGVIPSRYQSSRFEGKPLAEINGVPMIKRTYLQAKKSSRLDDLVVATEDKRIVDYCKSEQIPVLMTSKSCLTGTDRVAEVVKHFKHDFFINIQGDEPVIDPSVITQLIEEYDVYGDKYIAYNLYKNIASESEINSNTIIKVIVNENDELMYMSRLPVPYSNSGFESRYKQQIPVYGFTRKALNLFTSSDKTINEKYEDIELLRFVDMGYKLKMLETNASSIAVDIPSDIFKVENFLNHNEII